MASTHENRDRWSAYDWPQGGDEWSEVWGGTPNLWWGTLYPRIRGYVPAPTILEIAPGFGRCSQFLKDLCERLVLVDITERCIDACKERFRDEHHISYHVNDGRSLAMVEDGSVDFAFSFDSLVHTEAEVARAYVSELSRKLTPDGVAFLHHSNLAALVDPRTGQPPFENRHWRALTVSAALYAELCAEASLACIVQEVVNWGCDHLTDCLTVFTPRGSRFAGPLRRVENPGFMDEALALGRVARLYGAALPTAPPVGSR